MADIERDARMCSSAFIAVLSSVPFEAYHAALRACIPDMVGKPVRDIFEPQLYGDVCESEYRNDWEWAMEQELNGLKSNNTFVVTDVPPSRKPVGAK